MYRPTYNEAGLLETVSVSLRGDQNRTPFVTDIDYNAKGQRTLIEYGNGAQTSYSYDGLTFRLVRLRTIRPPGKNGLAPIFTTPTVLQDLTYTYDPAGNITHLNDAAIATVFHNGQQITPSSDCTYDALYRLIEANGREHITQTALDTNPGRRRSPRLPVCGAAREHQ